MTVKHSHAVEAVVVTGGFKTTKQVLISDQEAPNFALRRFIMEPGGGMPRHTNTVEHEQYVLTGTARITIADETIDVQTGDVLFIPAGVPHSYQNTGSGNFAFLCIIPNQPDTISTIIPADPAC